MQLYVIGVNHNTAPIQIRERIAFNSEHLGSALCALTTHDASEAAILSTCNRTELYCCTDDPAKPLRWLSHYHQLSPESIAPYVYTLTDVDVVRHAFRVAAGLDSMVLGEPQILGQFKQAVRIAQDAGTLGALLHKLFQRTFEVAKDIRTNTDIGANSTSMAAAGVKLAQQIFGDLRQQKVLFIGAGEMVALCAEHFATQHPQAMWVANRTLERGVELAQKIGGQAILLNDLPEHFAQFDIVVTSTASQLPIIGLGMVERAVKARRHRPIFIVDLAVPRDVESEVAQLDDVFLYTVDDLAQVVSDGIENRQAAALDAEEIVSARVAQFMQWAKKRGTVSTIKALRDQVEAMRKAELKKASKLLQKGQSAEQVLEALSVSLSNKFLHAPSHVLHQTHGEALQKLEQILRQLYQIKD